MRLAWANKTICAVVFLGDTSQRCAGTNLQKRHNLHRSQQKSAHDVRPARRAASSVLPLPRPALATRSRVFSPPCGKFSTGFSTPDFMRFSASVLNLGLNRLRKRHALGHGECLATMKKAPRAGLRSGLAVLSLAGVPVVQQHHSTSQTQAQRCPWVIHQRQQPLQRVVCLRQAVYQAGSVAAA